MNIQRRKTKIIKIGNVCIGGNNPIAIQSMTKTKTSDIQETIKELKRLKAAGCEVVRLSVKDIQDAKAIRKLKESSGLPIVADIHFNWRFALEAINNGVDKIRLNPGNIYKKEQIKEIVRAAKISQIPIRIGVNSGSLRSYRLRNSPREDAKADRMVKSALDYITLLEGFKFYDIVVSLKSSNIFDTIEAYRRLSKSCAYPLHLGVTAAGSTYIGAVKSSIAIGVLLLEGIGDTIRVSLTDKPQNEVVAAKAILNSLGLRVFSPEIISCPTCGRCEVNLVKIVQELEGKLSSVGGKRLTVNARPLRVAVMGCIVNGPGEAKEADLGVAFGTKEGLLFKNGKSLRKIPPDRCVDVLLEEILRSNQKPAFGWSNQ